MPYALNNAETKNEYTQVNSLVCPGSVRFNLHVFNAAVYFRIGSGPGIVSGPQAGAEIFRAPGYYSFDRLLDQVEVRSAANGVPARVTIDAWRAGELSA